MKKDLNYYMALGYKIEIVPIPKDEGGGFMARLPQFGTLGIVGDGDTPEKALANLSENQKDRFQQYIDEGLDIHEPDMESDEYSGRFVVRIPKFLHRELAQSAQKNGSSLNQYVSILLAKNFPTDQMEAALADIQEQIQSLNQCIDVLNYQVEKKQPYASGYIYLDDYTEAA